MLKVADLLNADGLEGITFVAGSKKKDNLIFNVNILENPDTLDWLIPGEFLLTTGFAFKDNKGVQKQVIRELSKMNCAALGFKIQRYFDEVPEELIKIADEMNLPVLSIPYNYTFSHIIFTVNEMLTHNRGVMDNQELYMHNKMYQVLEAGNGSEHLLQQLAESIQNPVLLLDENFHFLNFYDLPKNPFRISSIFQNDTQKQLFEKQLLKKTDSLLRFYQEPAKIDIDIRSHTVSVRIFPIKKKNIILSYLVVFNLLSDLQPTDLIQIKIAARYLLLQLQLEYSRKFEEYKQKNELFFNLITNQTKNPELLQQFIDYYQLKKDAYYSVLILSLDSEPNIENTPMTYLSNYLNQILSGYKQKIISIEYGHFFILLLEEPPKENEGYLEETKRIAKSIQNQIKSTKTEINSIIAIGPIVSHLNELHLSYQQALEIVYMYNTNEYKTHNHQILSYDDIFFQKTILTHFSKEGQDLLLKRIIFPILELDKEERLVLLSTLQSYYLMNRNITKAAKSLYIHRNTMIHRLKKIEELLNINLENPKNNLQLEFTLALFHYLQNNLPT
ncbi:PucR family transcriptional regulator [Oceanobacillus neutriphilus]|uniref:Purine catabolism regulatory protein n=1 Tax=Oceanobacillus neutriphilus TaxID=531815 RepID=A0ABQ2NUF2_9BACI|nr:PucR family transcriptional regulator ligand-binding domain-containing protein [Oceanobacillus neutriphilus]GGP10800.1 purine catabolism regulatory protein [Oceanobacillus neutriphilus]